MKLNRVMIAAPKSGSGKTMITCALLQALKNTGRQVVSYKCGPDYIDPMFHREVIGVPARNLDTFFTDGDETRRLFLKDRREEEFAVFEGVMGLFDGLGGIREEGSSYHLAKVTGTPIVLVVDAKGMGRSVIPLIAGFLSYDSEKLIKGIILNRMSEAYYRILCPFIEEELGVRMLGYFPENRQLQIESRHLGLKLPGELSDIKKKLETAAEKFQATVSLDEIVRIAEEAERQVPASEACRTGGNQVSGGWTCLDADGQSRGDSIYPKIAVARDEAFCFYYEDNLCLLREFGAEVVYFSPLRDRELPEESSGLLLGGGYPELYAEALSSNKEMLKTIRAAMESGMPVVAECGGFMYLHAEIEDKEGRVHAMAGVLPGRCYYTGKLVRFGYIELEEKQENFLQPGKRIRGHEFHYYDSMDSGEDCLATKPVSGKNYPCIISHESHWLGFPHLYYPSNPEFCRNFVRKAQKYQTENGIFVKERKRL